MRQFFKRNGTKLAALLALVILVTVCLVGSAYSKYRSQVAVSGSISYSTQLADSFTLQTEGETKRGASDACFIPGTTVSRDPSISIARKSAVKAVLYIEVTVPEEISCRINPCWTPLNVTGPRGGQIYVYENGMILDETTPDNFQAKVLAEETLELSSKPIEKEITMEVVGYLVQINETYTDPGAADAELLFAARLGQ